MATDSKYAMQEVTVNCSCKNKFQIMFNKDMPKSISIEKCNKCHPAYNDTVIDTSNTRDKKVQKFNEKCDFSNLFDD